MEQQINKVQEGEQIDSALLKNVIDIFVEIGTEQMELYDKYREVFEEYISSTVRNIGLQHNFGTKALLLLL